MTLIAAAILAQADICKQGMSDDSGPPNIVFIMADDLGYGDLGCYGQRLIRTPHIDALAGQGIRFTQAYAGGPVCAASRAVLMTGMHNGHAPARDNIPHYDAYLDEDDVTLAEVLQLAGYRTGGVGKWSLGDAGTVGRATNQGFDTWLGYLNQDHAHFYYTEYLDDDEGRLELPGNSQSHEHYSHDLLTERALEFISNHEDDPRPFFLYVAYTLPHFSAKAEDPDKLAVPSTEPYSDRDWSEHDRKYAAMIDRLDRDVGRMTQQVEQSGLSEQTLFIFTSDNGGHHGAPERFDTNGPLRGYKSSLNEGGIRVPLIARWPGTISAGEISDEVIAFQDFLPTLAELARADAPENLDGISIVDALKGGTLSPRHVPLYWDYGHCRARYDQAVRRNDWKGIRLGREGEIELYDLTSDPGESNNVASRHPEVVARIAEIMRTAPVPSERYPIGTLYRGKPHWSAKTHHRPVESQ